MAPLGVLTAIVSTTRVGGPGWLKALIGRARENLNLAELELMSSVSKEVCEVWNGRAVVRSAGRPKIEQIIYLPANNGEVSPEDFVTLGGNVALVLSNESQEAPTKGNLRGE